LSKAVLKFHKIELKNYRPFLDDVVEFSQDDNKPVTIVEGRNSAGKTSLIHAIHWCLYGQEKDIQDQSKGKPRCNKSKMYALKINESFDTEVTVTFSDEDGPKFVINRKLVVKRFSDDNQEKYDTDAAGKVPKGITFSTGVAFQERKKDGSWDSTDIDSIFTSRVQKLIPDGVSEFIIFNGESLDSFFKTDSIKKIEAGIKKVSGLPVLDLAINHCEKMESTYKKKSAKDAGLEADILNTQIEKTKEKVKKAKIEIQRDEKNISELDEAEKILEIEREKLGGAKRLDELKRHLDDEKRHKKEYEDFVERITNDKRQYLIENFAFTLCHPNLKHAQEILKKSELSGETPPPIQDYFVHDLIETKTCICGREPLDKNALEKLEILEQSVIGSQIADIATEGKNVIRKAFRDNPLEKISEKLTEFREGENRYKSAYKEARERVDGLLSKLEDIKEKDIEKNIKDLKKIREQKDDIGKGLPYKRSILSADEQKISLDEKELEKLLGETKTAKKWKQLKILASMAKADLLTIKYELLDEIREDVRKTCEEIFMKIIARGDEIKKIDIKDNYEMEVLDQYDDNILGTLSAGQFLFLSLAYIAAVRKITDTNFPMIIDSPLGRIDAEQRTFVAKTLPSYLSNIQLSLFVTNVEIDAIIERDTETGQRIGSVRELWNEEERISKNWLIRIEKKDELSKIEEIKN
jgi:DNA sulfur modification protein DndD